MLDVQALAASVALIVRETTAPLIARIEKLEAAKPLEFPELPDFGPVIEAVINKALAEIPPAKDGIGISSAMIDRDGYLVLVLEDGRTLSLGEVVGKSVDMDEVGRMIGDAVAAIPAPKDGKDGFSLDAFDIEAGEDGRTLTLKFESDEMRKSFDLKLPTAIYRGVFREGETYEFGDLVTWAGSVWHAEKETAAKPDQGGDWTLMVKRGRDGKDLRAPA